MNALLIVYLALASRFHGGGFFPAARVIRSFVFALPYGFISPIAFIVAALCKNIGHEDFWLMGTGKARSDRNWLCNLVLETGLKRDSLAFCWLGMAIKGALIALGTFNPVIIAGHALALPLAYYIGRRTRFGSELAEYLSGVMFACSIILTYGGLI